MKSQQQLLAASCKLRATARGFVVRATAGAAVVFLALVASLGATLAPLDVRPAHGTDPTLTITRLHYDGGGDWYANPSSLPNLLAAIRERTGLPVASEPDEVRLTDPDLREHPYLYMTGHGNFRLGEREVMLLREYLRSGGFLHADDNYGLDESFRREMARVFPDRELTPIPASHPVYHSFYDFPDGLPKIHEHDGKPAQGLGIFEDGRLLVFYSYESDLGDGWEDPDVHDDPRQIREAALRMGVNLFVYAVSQVVV